MEFDMCPRCNSNKVTEGQSDLEHKFTGRTIKATYRHIQCDACGSRLYPAAGQPQTVALELARGGPVAPDTFRWLRMSLAIPAPRLLTLLGISKADLVAWETGRAQIPVAVWVTVAALVEDQLEGRSHTLARLESLQPRSETAAPAPG